MMTALQQNKRKVRKLIWVSMMFCLALIIAAWHHPTRKDFIKFSILSVGAASFFGLISKRMQRISFLFERILFYTVLAAIMSIIIPVIDAVVMAAAALLCELNDKYRKEGGEPLQDNK